MDLYRQNQREQQQDLPVEWMASILSIACSSFRALNVGYQGVTYLISILAYIIFIAHATKRSQVVLNVFYIFTAFVGAWRWI